MQLSQLDLQAALRRSGTAGEDIQDQEGTVDHPAGQGVLQIALLGRGELPVKNDEIACRIGGQPGELLQTARPDTGGGVRTLPLLHQAADDLGPGRAGQFLQFIQGTVRIVFPRVHRGQNGGLGHGLESVLFFHKVSSRLLDAAVSISHLRANP